MKIVVKPHFSVKLQASQYNPIEENGGLDIELEVENEKEAKEKYLEFQKWIRTKNVESAIEGVKAVKEARKKVLKDLEENE